MPATRQTAHSLFTFFFVICFCVIFLSIANGQSISQGPAKARLEQAIEDARKFPEQDYSFDSWNAMRFSAGSASELLRNQSSTVSDLDRAHKELKEKISSLKKRPVLPDRSPKIGLSASLFAIDPDGPLNNVQLQWGTAEPFDRAEISRSQKESGPFEKIYSGKGRSFNDYGLKEGTYFYRLETDRNGRKLTANVVQIKTQSLPPNLQKYSNKWTNPRGLPGEPIKAGGTYYQFKTTREGTGVKVIQRTSKDAENWEDGPVVMDATSHPDLADCKFEAVNIFYDDVNDQIVWWCHWELAKGYAHGRAMVATAKPGERFKVHHVYNPLGVEVRDMSVFVDEDKQGYLVTAGNVSGQGPNATLYIFKLNQTKDDVVEIVAKVLDGGNHEAPHIVKDRGTYYMFFSLTAGWYPSKGGYVSAPSLAGPWTPERPIGNFSTFSSQSGGISEYASADHKNHVMMGNRWVRGEKTNQNVALPIHFADGFAFYDYAPTLLHDSTGHTIVSLHMGRLLSQDKPVKSSIPAKAGQEASKAFDGDYNTSFQSDQKDWPFSLTTDLGGPRLIRNIQISWYIHKGSEAYYTYTIEGSVDGKKWTKLLDRTDQSDTSISKTYGFTSDEISNPDTPARYVRLNVIRAHLQNNPNNWYPPTIYEVKIFGDDVREEKKAK